MPSPPERPTFETTSAAIADNVRRRRDAAGLSAADLAGLAGTSKGTVVAVERGTANPTVETVHLLAAALGCSIGELLDGSPDPMLVHRPGTEPHAAVGTLDGRLLQRFLPTGPVEVFEIALTSTRTRTTPPHADGVYEHIWVAEGRLLTGPTDEPIELARGDYVCFPGWFEHSYQPLETPVRMLLLLSLKRTLSGAAQLHHGASQL